MTFTATILTTYYGTLLPEPLNLTVTFRMDGNKVVFVSGMDDSGEEVDVGLLNPRELKDAWERSRAVGEFGV